MIKIEGITGGSTEGPPFQVTATAPADIRVELLHRVVVPSRLALIYRGGESLGYNPAINSWERLDQDCAETLRWLRAGRDRRLLEGHLLKRFEFKPFEINQRVRQILAWCILRHLLYLDREPDLPALVPPPNPLISVYWICTQACNLRCTYCYQEATVARPRELSTAEAKGLVDQVVEAGVKTLVITGGEPFMRRDLLEVARYAKGRGLRTTVITNGHFIKREDIGEIREIFDVVTISLDHMIPDYHDRHRGKGSWQRALDAIDSLLERGVRVDVNSTLFHGGLEHLKELLELRQKREIGLHKIVPQFPMGRGAGNREDELSAAELLQLSDRLSDAKRQVAGTESSIRPEGAYSSKGKTRVHCGAGLSEVSIDPEGWVYPCKLLQQPQFRTQNIRDARLTDIFANDPTLNAIQGRVVHTLHPCKTCVIKNHCGGGCRGIHVSFTQEYLDAHPLFCSYLRRTFETHAWESTGAVPASRKTTFQDPAAFPVDIVPLSSLLRTTQ